MLNQKVVVTTDKDRRGVFFGTLLEFDRDRRTVVLCDARNAIYWSHSTRGFMGLAAIGPQDGSRISPAVPRIELDGVCSVCLCSDVAVQRWEAGPWK